jgi:hypothetical protein
MESNRYVITAALAASLGITGTLVGAGLTEKEGFRLDRSVDHTKSPSEISGVQNAINNFATNSACPALINEGAPSCVADDVFQMRFSRNFRDENGNFFGRVEASVNGNNYQGAPTLTAGQVTQLRNFLVNNFCEEIRAKVPASSCDASNIFEARFTRPYASPQTNGWSARAEGIFRMTCSEGAPDT